MAMTKLYLFIFGWYCVVATNTTSPNNTTNATHCSLINNHLSHITLYSFDKNPHSLGSTIYFSCEKNYKLFGPKKIKCKRRGWSTKKLPVCKARKCPNPGHPQFGRRTGSNFTVGAAVVFRCNSGFRLYGSKKRVCQENRRWSGSLTTCYDHSSHCPDPGIPIGSRKFGNNYNLGKVVKYSCKYGYSLKGSKYRTCLGNGTWSGTTPVCEGIIPPIDVVSQLFRKNFVDRLMNKTCSSRSTNCTDKLVDPRLKGFRSRYRGGLDLTFVLDSSSSVTENFFKVGLDLVKEMVRMFGIDQRDDGTRVACVSFGTKPKLEFGFRDHSVSTTAKAIARISKVKFQGGSTATRQALDIVRSYVLPMARKHSKKAVMFITDGNSNMGKPGPAARRLRSLKVEVYVIGVGRSVRKEELRSIASWPYEEHVFRIENRLQIEDLIDSITDYSECGKMQRPRSRVRIVGGKYSQPAQWPWTLLMEGPEGLCGATLINRRWALTAAHCIVPDSPLQLWQPDYDPSKYNVKLGYTNLGESKPYHIDVGIEEMFVHDFYVGEPSLINDIGLLKLKVHPAFDKYSKYIQRICLPDSFNFTQLNNTGGIAVGWGGTKHRVAFDETPVTVSNSLKEVFLPFVNDSLCKQRTVVDQRDDSGWLFDRTTMFCAGKGLGVNDTCTGDSGGPFMVKRYDKSLRSYRWYQVGITSWGVGCANTKEYAYMTKVTAYVDWIKRIINENT